MKTFEFSFITFTVYFDTEIISLFHPNDSNSSFVVSHAFRLNSDMRRMRMRERERERERLQGKEGKSKSDYRRISVRMRE